MPGEKTLRGIFHSERVDTAFSWTGWFDESYQKHQADYLNDNFGFRNSLVRFNNELDFLFFNKANVFDLAVGKDNFMYQLEYIDAYNGVGFTSREVVEQNVQELKKLQDELKKMGKSLLFVMAPSKARLYPEYLPEERVTGPTTDCFYIAYLESMKKNGVNLIDFNEWYAKKKMTSPYLLYPQFGVHYSRYETVLAADTIVKRFSALSGKQLPSIRINALVEKDTLEPPDDDAIVSMNLMWWPAHKKTVYPQYDIVNADKANEDLLVIADSYWRDIYAHGIPAQIFRNNEYWYYFGDVEGNNHYQTTGISKIDIKRHLLQYDNILIMCTESKLGNFTFGFVKKALEELKKEIVPTPKEIDEYVQVISRNGDWLNAIRKKAAERNVSVESVLRADAAYMVRTEGPLVEDPSIEDAEQLIRNNQQWFQQIKDKAAQRKISVDSMLTLDAIFVLEERKRKRGY